MVDDPADGDDLPTGCHTLLSGAQAEINGLLSLALSSKGGEGNNAAVREHRDACSAPLSSFGGEGWGEEALRSQSS